MRKNLLIGALTSMALAVSAGTAQADAIAGWDFSQYFSSGFLSIDGATFSNTLDANYSDLDPTFNAGAESAAFGTMYMDGTNGSSFVDPASPTAEFIPLGGSLTNNLNPFQGGAGFPFDSLTILVDEGQTFANLLSMVAQNAVSVVFEADLSSVGGSGENWQLDLSGVVAGGNAASVGVEYSTDGVSYTGAGTLNLTATDSLFSVPLGAGPSEQQFLRLSFDPADGNPVIDNLSISAGVTVPEPGTLLLGLSGIVGLGLFGNRRRA